MKKIIKLGLFKYNRNYINHLVQKLINKSINYNDALNIILNKIIYKFTIKINYKCKFYNYDDVGLHDNSYLIILQNYNTDKNVFMSISNYILINFTNKDIKLIEKEYYGKTLAYIDNMYDKTGSYLISRGINKSPEWVKPNEHLKYNFNFKNKEKYISFTNPNSAPMYTFKEEHLDICHNILFRNYLYELYVDYIVNCTNYRNTCNNEPYYDDYVANKVKKK